ncbi:MAG: Thiamin-phosphate pyrophosphorylase, partial [uncultured Thermomicrobiales bacterium]
MERDYTLYYVLDLPDPAGRDAVALVREAVAGGAGIVQLRGEGASGRELYELALELKGALAATGVPLIVNDRLDVALATEADGIHVGAQDLPVGRVRALAPGLIVGVSCYGDPALAERAAAAGADYLAFGAFFPSPSKPEAAVVPTSVLGEARRFGLPVVAIGGITLDRTPQLAAAGADGIAAISAIQGAPEPRAAAAALRAAVV